jgi:hypothetical protein
LLIPSAGDARPVWTLDDFKRAVGQARNGKIAVIQLHGVPDTAHAWVNTPAPLFESYIEYLAANGFRVIALRDLARYIDPEVLPADPWRVIEDRKRELSAGPDRSRGVGTGSFAAGGGAPEQRAPARSGSQPVSHRSHEEKDSDDGRGIPGDGNRFPHLRGDPRAGL